tara:strand:+ start:132 stop:284 length:153 start_codon:yes stop_codon:yes gene_type:complete
MGVTKKHAPVGESIDVGSLRLRMPTKASNPIIEVVNCDKQNIGLFRIGRL